MDNILITIFKLFFLGIYDSLINCTALLKLDRYVSTQINRKTERKEREIQSSKEGFKRTIRLYFNRHKVLKCCIWCTSLSILIYGSISVFYSYLMPLLKSLILLIVGKVSLLSVENSETQTTQTTGMSVQKMDQVWSNLEWLLSHIFNGLWLLPLFIVSKIVCSFWFSEVAENCYFITYKKTVTNQTIANMIADLLFSVLVQIVFLLQCNIINLFPITGANYLLNLIHCSLLHAWYAFEYKWINFGWDVKKRLLQLHTFWPYYVGFGLPMHLITTELVNVLSDYKKGILGGCLFSAFFPVMIVSAISTARELKVGESSTVILRLFQPSVIVSDWLLVKLQRKRKRGGVEKKKTR